MQKVNNYFTGFKPGLARTRFDDKRMQKIKYEEDE
jgi:hypothetical protein